mmetsp:Transcript_124854/g.266422  ORF Transcript_124854/g.266422 Transcript_124854/m.266422 type:complete len:418 (+) Transcript_124854:319-1572(+)
MHCLLEPGEAILKLRLHVGAPACGSIEHCIGLNGGDHLQKLPRKFLVPLTAFFQLLEALDLQAILQVAVASLELLESRIALLHSALLRLDPRLQGLEAHERLRVARLRVRVVLHGLHPLGVVHVNCWIELCCVHLLQLLDVLREGIRVGDEALLRGSPCGDPFARSLLQDRIELLHALRKLHADELRLSLRTACAHAHAHATAHAHAAAHTRVTALPHAAALPLAFALASSCRGLLAIDPLALHQGGAPLGGHHHGRGLLLSGKANEAETSEHAGVRVLQLDAGDGAIIREERPNSCLRGVLRQPTGKNLERVASRRLAAALAHAPRADGRVIGRGAGELWGAAALGSELDGIDNFLSKALLVHLEQGRREELDVSTLQVGVLLGSERTESLILCRELHISLAAGSAVRHEGHRQDP